MDISKEEIVKIASLARLKLKEDEIDYFASQMNNIVEFVNKLSEVNVNVVEEEYKPTPLREDLPQPSLDPQKALLNAPEKRLDMFVVPKFVDG